MKWLWTIAIKKAISRGVQAVIAIIAQAKVQAFLNGIGVQVSIDPTVASAAVYGALEFLRNWLKVKVGVKLL